LLRKLFTIGYTGRNGSEPQIELSLLGYRYIKVAPDIVVTDLAHRG